MENARPISVRERLETNIVWWSLIMIAVGFAAGFGAYGTILTVANREVTREETREQVEKPRKPLREQRSDDTCDFWRRDYVNLLSLGTIRSVQFDSGMARFSLLDTYVDRDQYVSSLQELSLTETKELKTVRDVIISLLETSDTPADFDVEWNAAFLSDEISARLDNLIERVRIEAHANGVDVEELDGSYLRPARPSGGG